MTSMENSEDLDMDIHDAKRCVTQSVNTRNATNPKKTPNLFSSQRDEYSTKNITNEESLRSNLIQNEENRLQILKASFRKDLLTPQKIINPKKDKVYKRQVLKKQKSTIFNFGELGSSSEKTEQDNKEFLTETGILKQEVEAQQLPSYNKHKRHNTTKNGGAVAVISPKELLRMRDMSGRGMLQKHKSDSTILDNLAPQLDKGLLPVQERSAACSPSVGNRSTQNLAKMRAIQKIKNQGQLKQKDPNSTKPSLKSCKKVKAVLEKSFVREKEGTKAKTSALKSKLGNIDFESERVKALLKRGSSHAYEVEMTEMQKEASYFSSRERKEEMEEKMASIKEIICDVVSCLQCKYTADTAAERCKKEQHPLKSHKSLKRFFECKECKRRTVAFSKFPKMACKRCSGSKFVRTSMMKVCIIQQHEKLHISGDNL